MNLESIYEQFKQQKNQHAIKQAQLASSLNKSVPETQSQRLSRENKEKKLKALKDLKKNHEDQRSASIQSTPAVIHIKGQVDDNNLAILKLLQANEILAGSLENHEKEAGDEFEKHNPPQYTEEEIRRLEGDVGNKYSSIQDLLKSYGIKNEYK